MSSSARPTYSQAEMSTIINEAINLIRADLLGHQDYLEQALKRLYTNSFPAALMIAGAKGLGKNQIAQSLAAYWLYSGTQNTDLPAPPSDKQLFTRELHLMQNESHPDVRLLSPIANKNQAEDAAQISVTQVRDLLTFLRQTPSRGRNKAAVILNAEQMNNQAANALLKALEEPRPHTCMILTSSNPSALLPTIRSRLSLFHAKALSAEQMLSFIQQRQWRNDAALRDFAQGRPFIYQQLIEALPDGLVSELAAWSMSAHSFTGLIQFCNAQPRLALELIITFGLKNILSGHVKPDKIDLIRALPQRYERASAINLNSTALWRSLLCDMGLAPRAA